MPTYEYKCRECDKHFDFFQGMNSEPLTVCRDCGGALKRLLGTGAGIIFKGSGFYETDYRRKNSEKTAAANSSSSSAKNNGSGDGKSDKSETTGGDGSQNKSETGKKEAAAS